MDLTQVIRHALGTLICQEKYKSAYLFSRSMMSTQVPRELAISVQFNPAA